jgi:aminomethyltransferase
VISLRQSPLADRHFAAGAKMVDFGGWEMPLEYHGTIAEHLTCRTAAVMFDVSHLGTVRMSGDESYQILQRTLTNDLAKIAPGRAQYTHLLDEDGSVADDIIVWWWQSSDPTGGSLLIDVFDVMPNASNTDRVIAALGGTDITNERAVIAVQGPTSRTLVAKLWPEAAQVGRFRVTALEWRGHSCVVAGTGYTGEDGIEIALPTEAAGAMWDAFAEVGIAPAGLGARDTLRLEAGLPLHGHELGPGITPLQAGLEWVVAFDKPAFRGRAALRAERDRGVLRRLRGLSITGRRPVRAGYQVKSGDQVCGEVTSGNFSPVLQHGIALALLDATIEIGEQVSVDLRGTPTAATVVPTPFVQRGSSATR